VPQKESHETQSTLLPKLLSMQGRSRSRHRTSERLHDNGFSPIRRPRSKGVPGGIELLNWVYDEVIRGKRARGFLVGQRFSNDSLLNALFDARVLHLVRRGYSAQDAPGERYDVYLIDFGACVDLINTQAAPQELSLDLDGLEGPEDREDDLDAGGSIDVPVQDLRALRRAILDLDAFYEANPALRTMDR
jgi:hypothetical protein